MGEDRTGDGALAVAAAGGDQQAFAEIFDRYGPRIHAFCVRVLGDPHTAADATQDTFVTAARRLDQLRDPTKLRPWLYAVARNECTRHGRARDRAVPVEDAAMRADAQLGADDAPAQAAASAEVGELLWAAAAGLDERDRTLLDLHLRHGLDGTDLALAAGIAPGQISMATGRMRDRLERSIGALLVARRGREDCPALQAVLADWDGTFSVLVRKRVARHVEACEHCGDRRRALVAPLGSLAISPMLVPFTLGDLPDGLREQVLEAVRSTGAATSAAGEGADVVAGRDGEAGEAMGWGADGFPPLAPEPEVDPDDPDEVVVDLRDRPTPSRRRAAVGLVALLLVLGIGALLASGAGRSGEGDGAGEVASGTSAVADPTSTVGAPSTTAGEGRSTVPPPSTDEPETSTTSQPADGPVATTAPEVVPPAETPTTEVSAVPFIPPTDPTPEPPVDDPPVVAALVRSGTATLQTTCNPDNDTRTVTVSATDDVALAAVVLRWDHGGSGPGQRTMVRQSGSTWRATLGPFGEVGTVTLRVVATDSAGQSASTPTVSVDVEPCPG
jgi:RNA polymerase sigma factor (sigma-70 family)